MLHLVQSNKIGITATQQSLLKMLAEETFQIGESANESEVNFDAILQLGYGFGTKSRHVSMVENQHCADPKYCSKYKLPSSLKLHLDTLRQRH